MIKFSMRPVPNLRIVNKEIMKLLSAFEIRVKDVSQLHLGMFSIFLRENKYNVYFTMFKKVLNVDP